MPPLDPDLALVARVDCPFVAEGWYETAALQASAYAVVVGTAITNPVAITARLVEEIRTLTVA